MKDYYSILGVSPDASSDEIKVAHRKLSMKFHPDKNNGDEFFAERFKMIQEAWEILGNQNFRNYYDQERSGGANKEIAMPQIIFFKADKTTFDLDEEIVFTWETVNADKVTLSSFGIVLPSGSTKYRIKIIKSAILNFELVAENSLHGKIVTSSVSLSKRNIASSLLAAVETFDSQKFSINAIKVLEGICLVLVTIIFGLAIFAIVKDFWNTRNYEPYTVRFLLNQLGGNIKLFINWVYEPQSFVKLNNRIGWIFKIIFIIPSVIPLFLISIYIIKLWFRLISFVVELAAEELGKVSGLIALVAIFIWMITWFI